MTQRPCPSQPDPLPTPEYLLGAMVEDHVPRVLAVKIADGYAAARQVMSPEQTHKWLNAMIANLGPMGEYPNTAMSVLCLPSEHEATRYAELAHADGWKEGDDARTEAP